MIFVMAERAPYWVITRPDIKTWTDLKGKKLGVSSTTGTQILDTSRLLKLHGVEKHFGPVQALYNVDLDLPAGQVTALVGDNGAGKSVLTKCIAGIYQIDHGQFFWEGRPVQIHSPRDSARLSRPSRP